MKLVVVDVQPEDEVLTELALRSYIRELLTEGSRYYFAYGSNMDQSRLHRRSFSGPPCILDTHLDLGMVGIAKLPEYELGFAGYSETWDGPTATLVPSPGSHVPGVVYLTDSNQEAALSCFENADDHRNAPTHIKVALDVICEDGRVYKCYSFVHRQEPSSAVPPEKYLRALQSAYDARGIEA